jgi:hypothetical protein
MQGVELVIGPFDIGFQETAIVLQVLVGRQPKRAQGLFQAVTAFDVGQNFGEKRVQKILVFIERPTAWALVTQNTKQMMIINRRMASPLPENYNNRAPGLANKWGLCAYYVQSRGPV